MEEAQPGTVPCEVRDRGERAPWAAGQGFFLGGTEFALDDIQVKRLEDGEGPCNGAQIRGRACDMEGFREREVKAAESGERE